MADNIARKVMANIAAKNGYAPQQPVPSGAGRAALHLDEEEQAMLLRAIQGDPGRKGPAPKGPSAPAGGTAAPISLEELARKKR